MENEDYAQFPAETLQLDFKNYSDYLKLDTGRMMNLYRGEQLVESQQPLEELNPSLLGKMIALELKSNKLLPLGIILEYAYGFFWFIIFLKAVTFTTVESTHQLRQLKIQIQ